MSNYAIAALAAAFLALAPPVLASQFQSTGIIAAVHKDRNVIYLKNGDAYRLPSHTDTSTLRPGDQVTVGWNTQSPRTYGPLSSDNMHIWLLDAVSLHSIQ